MVGWAWGGLQQRGDSEGWWLGLRELNILEIRARLDYLYGRRKVTKLICNRIEDPRLVC
jgi:hypothetical protein